MNRKRISFKLCGFVMLIQVLPALTAFAGLTNGDFSAGLSGWTTSGIVFYNDVNELAVLIEITDQPGLSSTLSQEFVIPSMAMELSFDVSMGQYDDAETDVFTAALYMSSTDLTPLISYSPDVDEFFYMDNEGETHTYGTFDGMTARLDVSAFRDSNAYLVFGLLGSDDSLFTAVELDNVNISISTIPAPSALMLGFIGIGLVGIIRRKKAGKLN